MENLPRINLAATVTYLRNPYGITFKDIFENCRLLDPGKEASSAQVPT